MGRDATYATLNYYPREAVDIEPKATHSEDNRRLGIVPLASLRFGKYPEPELLIVFAGLASLNRLIDAATVARDQLAELIAAEAARKANEAKPRDISDPDIVPTIDEALADPVGFVAGMTEVKQRTAEEVRLAVWEAARNEPTWSMGELAEKVGCSVAEVVAALDRPISPSEAAALV